MAFADFSLWNKKTNKCGKINKPTDSTSLLFNPLLVQGAAGGKSHLLGRTYLDRRLMSRSLDDAPVHHLEYWKLGSEIEILSLCFGPYIPPSCFMLGLFTSFDPCLHPCLHHECTSSIDGKQILEWHAQH